MGDAPYSNRAADELFTRHYLRIRDQAESFFCRRMRGRGIASYSVPRFEAWEPAEVGESVDAVADGVHRRLRNGLSQLRDRGRFDAWLFTLTLNICRDRWRQLRRNAWLRVDGLDRQCDFPDDALGEDPEAPATYPAVERLDVATRATGKLAYVAPHDLELAADELRYIARCRQEPLDQTLDRLWAQLAPLHDAMHESRTAKSGRLEARIGAVRDGLVILDRRIFGLGEPAAAEPPDPVRDDLLARRDRMRAQLDRLRHEAAQPRPRSWRLSSDDLARFLNPGFVSGDASERKRVVDALNQRLSRFRRAYRAISTLDGGHGDLRSKATACPLTGGSVGHDEEQSHGR